MVEETGMKRTPLFSWYKKNGVKLINFSGWWMPVQFTSILEEHETVRSRVGLFDVSHMGEILVEGEDAEAFLDRLVTNDLTKLNVNQAQYNAMCYPNGGTIDDLLIYRLEVNKYMVTPNASNTIEVFEWMQNEAEGQVTVRNISDETALLAVQGPKAIDLLEKLTFTNLEAIEYYRFVQKVNIAGVAEALVSRTGYTGEDGFEIYLKEEKVEELWKLLLDAGEEEGIQPCGLGARDTLRLEAGLALYGQELTENISPLEGGIGFAVKTQKESPFIGKEALVSQKAQGLTRKLVGFELTGKGIARHGHHVLSETGEVIGTVTSGTKSPTLNKSIGLALLNTEKADIGNTIKIEIRNKQVDATIVKTPFYKRKAERGG